MLSIGFAERYRIVGTERIPEKARLQSLRVSIRDQASPHLRLRVVPYFQNHNIAQSFASG